MTPHAPQLHGLRGRADLPLVEQLAGLAHLGRRIGHASAPSPRPARRPSRAVSAWSLCCDRANVANGDGLGPRQFALRPLDRVEPLRFFQSLFLLDGGGA